MQKIKTINQSTTTAHSIREVLEELEAFHILLVEPFAFERNTLTKIIESHQNQSNTTRFFDKYRNAFFQLAKDISGSDNSLLTDINDDFVEMEWILDDPAENNETFVQDQLMTVAAVISSRIAHSYFIHQGVACHWIDARDLFLANNNYGEGNLLHKESASRCRRVFQTIQEGESLIIPAPIAATTENFNITLGKTGSKKVVQFLNSIV